MVLNLALFSDIDEGGILSLIKSNSERNVIKSNEFIVEELDFFNADWETRLKRELFDLDIILVADVVYNEQITRAFFRVLDNLKMMITKDLFILIAMERRLWTNEKGEQIAPSHDVFVQCLHDFEHSSSNCEVKAIPIDFPHHFRQYYERVSELLMWKISFKSNRYG